MNDGVSSARTGRPVAFSRLGPQLALLIAVWAYLCALHWRNDGLWFQGDAPRHVANGLFWMDFLADTPRDPQRYALQYFARYPVINPTAYPPGFYLLEAAAFAAIGPSPQVAKGLVLLSTLAAGCYTILWQRRWIAPEAGGFGVLVLLLPGVVVWSHATMLNMPAFAATIGALYHAKRWADDLEPRQIYLASALSTLAVLCYYPAAVVVLVELAWLVALRRWRLVASPRTIAVAAACGAVLLPCAAVVFNWAPRHVQWATEGRASFDWAYYPFQFPHLFGWLMVGSAAAGVVAGGLDRRLRREVVLLLLWIAATLAFHSFLEARDPRYVLALAGPMAILAAIAPVAIARRLGGRAGPALTGLVAPVALALLLPAHLRVATTVRVPKLTGFGPLVSYIERVAADEPVFYEGRYDGVFSLLIRVGDPERRRRVVLGSKLLYAVAQSGNWDYRGEAETPGAVLEALTRRSGCRWIAVEYGWAAPRNPASLSLRTAVRGPQFEFIRSFPMGGPGIDRVDLYRNVGPVSSSEAVHLPFPILGSGVRYTAVPIPPRRAD